MKKFAVFLSLSFLPLTFCCTSSSKTSDPSQPTFPIEVLIHVSGADSLFYAGEYGNLSDTTQVSGMVPPGIGNYDIYHSSVENENDRVFACIHKQQREGGLKVDIYVDDHLKAWDQTTEAYDTVYVTWQPE